MKKFGALVVLATMLMICTGCNVTYHVITHRSTYPEYSGYRYYQPAPQYYCYFCNGYFTTPHYHQTSPPPHYQSSPPPTYHHHHKR
ncbi:MAG: hypothetical protein Q8Q37_00035 [bacterium]|nr:hypothetical protein [bacterium]